MDFLAYDYPEAMTATESGFKDRRHTVPQTNRNEINMIAGDSRRPKARITR
jgi:hypothetical protein